MVRSDIERILEAHPALREKLFAMGFLFTNERIDQKGYPFYGLWKQTSVGIHNLMVSPKQHSYVYQDGNITIVLVGHVYDPFSMLWDENEILRGLVEKLQVSEQDFFDQFNQLTGVFTMIFINDRIISVVGDPSGMQTTFYTNETSHVYISSHTNLIGDLLCLERDSYVEELSHYRFFPLLGNSLPGDLTPFSEVKRLTPNHFVSFQKEIRVKRFYWPSIQNKNPIEIRDEAAHILKNNMELIAKKWNRPAISLTGGCDSKTTLACANGLYDRFSFFSYISSEAEEVDAKAALQICTALHLRHTTHNIPLEESVLNEKVKAILRWNDGDLREPNSNDVRKRIYFSERDDFDIEVKSWASEIGRAYYSKRFNNKGNFGNKPTPRACTTLYKFFLNNRKLVKQTDSVFAEYIDKYYEPSKINPIPWQEQFFWEFRIPSWNGLVITGEHRYSFDITIPYNNRKLLELLLSASFENRVNDVIYRDIRIAENPDIDKTGISVINLKHTNRRAKMEDIYWKIHTKLRL